MKKLLILFVLLISVTFYSQKKYIILKTLKNYPRLKVQRITAHMKRVKMVPIEKPIILMARLKTVINSQI